MVRGRLVLGLVVITIGIIFLLEELQIADVRGLLRWLPALPLVYGVMLMTGVGARRNVPAGVLVTLLSGWFLLRALGVLTLDLSDLWPVALVVVGAWIAVAALRGPASPGSLEDAASTLRAFALWSGTARKVVSEDFRGGEVTAIMGGHEIDLRPARIVTGPAVIDLFVWWGGVEIRVPPDWKVTSQALPLLGGVEDATVAPEGEAHGHLILKGAVIMGGVEVKN